MCHINVSHMKTATIRELRHATTTVLAWVAQGETVEVRRRDQPVAILAAPKRRSVARRPDASLNMILADLAGGVLVAASPALGAIMTEAERLSALHTETLGTRSLDVLHVAAALVLGLKELLTFDARQAALARATGLRAPTL